MKIPYKLTNYCPSPQKMIYQEIYIYGQNVEFITSGNSCSQIWSYELINDEMMYLYHYLLYFSGAAFYTGRNPKIRPSKSANSTFNPKDVIWKEQKVVKTIMLKLRNFLQVWKFTTNTETQFPENKYGVILNQF